MLKGSWRFGLTSIIAFGVWALPIKMTTIELYSSITLVFLLTTGFLLYPLIQGPRKIFNLYKFFLPSFIAYAILWCIGWFGIKGNAGELFGSAAGLAAMVLMANLLFNKKNNFLACLGVLFLLHTLGYTLGGMLSYAAYGKGLFAPWMEGHIMLGKLLWGLFYGMGFGAGLGYLLYEAQSESQSQNLN